MTIQLRRDTAANWTETNPVLAQGEAGMEIDTKIIKIGDGITNWNNLYIRPECKFLTQVQYDAIVTKDPNVLYFITG